MLHTLPFAHQQRAGPDLPGAGQGSGLCPVLPRSACAGELVEVAKAGLVEIAERVGLQAIGEEAQQQVPGQVRGRGPTIEAAPACAQALEAKTAQLRDPGLERVRSDASGLASRRPAAR